MTQLTLEADRTYPNTPVSNSVEQHSAALQEIIEALNTGQRRNREKEKSWVRFDDLETLGLVTISGNIVTAVESSGGGGSFDLVDDTTPQLGADLDANSFNIDMGTNTITDTKVGQWDTAYGWGDHSTAGYLTGISIPTDINTATPPTNEAVTGNVVITDLAGDDDLMTLGFDGDNTLRLTNNFQHPTAAGVRFALSVYGSSGGTPTLFDAYEVRENLHVWRRREGTATYEVMTRDDDILRLYGGNSSASDGGTNYIEFTSRNSSQEFMRVGLFNGTDGNGDSISAMRGEINGAEIRIQQRSASAYRTGVRVTGNLGDETTELWSMVGTNEAVLRTVRDTDGGVEINNNDTGAGWERALTESDLGGGGTTNWSTGGGTVYGSGSTTIIESGAIMEFQEQSAMADPAAGYGRLWVRDDTPNVLVFTDDAGDDTVLSAGGGGSVELDEQDATSIAADLLLISDGANGVAWGTIELDDHGSTGAPDGYVLTADGAGAAAWEAIPGGGTTELDELDATGITDGYILTADGSDGAAWEAPSGGTVTDPHFSLVAFLANFNGADGATSFTSDDASAATATFGNDAELDDAQKKFGDTSLLLDGTGDYVSFPDDDRWDLGRRDFALECWARFNGAPGATSMGFASSYLSAGNQLGWLWYYSGAGSLKFGWTNNGSSFESEETSWSPSGDTWYHVAITRHKDVLYMFVDGVLLESFSFNENIFDSSAVLTIGAHTAGANVPFDGWIDSVRITVGHARYTMDFNVPITAFPEA